MSDKTEISEIVQYKSEDVSEFRRTSEILPNGNSAMQTNVWGDDVSELESDLAQDLLRIIVEQERPLTI